MWTVCVDVTRGKWERKIDGYNMRKGTDTVRYGAVQYRVTDKNKYPNLNSNSELESKLDWTGSLSKADK